MRPRTRREEDEREREAIIASPWDPRTEYVPASAGLRLLCDCPCTVLDADDDPRSWQLKVWHVRGCPRTRRARAERSAAAAHVDSGSLGAYLASLPRPIPCPARGCGEVAYSAGPRPGERRCHRCGHVWAPWRRAAA